MPVPGARWDADGEEFWRGVADAPADGDGEKDDGLKDGGLKCGVADTVENVTSSRAVRTGSVKWRMWRGSIRVMALVIEGSALPDSKILNQRRNQSDGFVNSCPRLSLRITEGSIAADFKNHYREASSTSAPLAGHPFQLVQQHQCIDRSHPLRIGSVQFVEQLLQCGIGVTAEQ